MTKRSIVDALSHFAELASRDPTVRPEPHTSFNGDPSKPMWIVIMIDGSDGLFTPDVYEAFDNEKDALAYMALERDEDDPVPHVCFECKPIVMHVRQPFKTIDLRKRK